MEEKIKQPLKMYEHFRTGHGALLPFPAVFFSFCFCSTRACFSPVWGLSEGCDEFKFSRMSSTLVLTLWWGPALWPEINPFSTSQCGNIKGCTSEAVCATTAPTRHCWATMPVLFSWNCCYWCQNQVHPVGHLYGHHRTKEGSVFSRILLLTCKNMFECVCVCGGGYWCVCFIRK